MTSVPSKQLCLGSVESGKGRKSLESWNCFLRGSFSLESKQEWHVLECFYMLGFSGGMFFQNWDFGKKRYISALLKLH